MLTAYVNIYTVSLNVCAYVCLCAYPSYLLLRDPSSTRNTHLSIQYIW